MARLSSKCLCFLALFTLALLITIKESKCNDTSDAFKEILTRLRGNHKTPIPVISRKSGVYQNVKIAAFNVRVFGTTKMTYPNVPEILVNIILRYDIILIMEIRDTTSTAIYELLGKVNQASNNAYRMVISPRLGRSSSKEEYAFLYRTKNLSVVRSYTYDDGDESLHKDTFEREPFIVQFRSTKAVIRDFALVSIHTSPSTAPQEVDSLVDVYDDVRAKWSIDDVIILGDLNSACSYMSDNDWKTNRLFNDPRFTWLIHDDVDTTVGSTMCAYDRFVIAGNSMKGALVPGTAGRFTFDAEYNLKRDKALLVSDHYPIELELYSKDFFNALQSIRQSVEYKFYSRSPPSFKKNDIYAIGRLVNPLLSNGFVNIKLKSVSGAIAVISNKKDVATAQEASAALTLIYANWGKLLTKDQVNLALHKVQELSTQSLKNTFVKLVCRSIPAPVECWVALET